MPILCFGLNHHTTSLAHREAFVMADDDARSAMLQLTAHQAVDEAVLLSTCNRIEWYLAASDSAAAVSALRNQLAAHTAFSIEQLDDFFYLLDDRAAVAHLMRVAAGLDSMVLGEPQVLGQVRQTYDMGLEAYSIGPQLAELFRDAIVLGKRARTETAISRNAVSIGSVVMRWVAARTALRKTRRVAVVGAGEMGALVVRHAVKITDARVRILNRTRARAQTLAAHIGATAYSLDALAETLTWADAVIMAAAAPVPLITPEHIPDRTAPLLLVDLAVPRSIDPAVVRHPQVHLFVLDDIQQLVQRNLAQRRAAIPQVEAMIEQAVADYMAWLNQRQVLPVLVGMRRKANALAQAELEQALRKLPADDSIVADQMSRLVHRLVNKLLHEPTLNLKAQAAQGNAEPYVRALQDLFSLEDYQN